MSIRPPRRPRLAVAVSLLGFGACASTTPAPRFTAVSPADPKAAESAVPAPPAILTGDGELAEDATTGSTPSVTPAKAVPIGAASGHEPHGSASDAIVYTCPMHPDLAEKAPGTCPICGMALVKKAIAPKERP